jgi:Fucose-binding lectin II (PA-IIL)
VLPASTKVFIYGYSNAEHHQRIRLLQKNGTEQLFLGQGENNTPATPPSITIDTPQGGSYIVTVTVECQPGGGGGPWARSNLKGAGGLLQQCGVYSVVSDDSSGDGDYNDSSLVFMWYNPVT